MHLWRRWYLTQFFDTISLVPEQVIEVPKILPEDVPMRTIVRVTQLADQLVEVPTIISFSSLLRIVEQNVDTPVPGREGRNAGLQGFPHEQSSTALHVSQERISERVVEQIVDSPVSGGGLQDFRPGRSSSSSLHVPAGFSEVLDEPGEEVFRTFPVGKSAPVAASPSVKVPRHVSSWTPAAYGETIGSDEWVQFSRRGKPFCWNRRSNETLWTPPEGVMVVWFGEQPAEGRGAEGRGLVLAQGNACQYL